MKYLFIVLFFTLSFSCMAQKTYVQAKAGYKIKSDSIRLVTPLTSSSTSDSIWVFRASDSTTRKLPQSALSASITANNGLTASTSTNVQLGGTLVKNTVIATASNTLSLSTSTASVNPLSVSASSGIGIYAQSTSGLAISAFTNGSVSGQFALRDNSTNTVLPVMNVQRRTFNTPAPGIGASIDFYLDATPTTTPLSNSIISKLTDTTTSARTSQFIITGVNGGSTNTLMTLDGNANATFGTTNSIVGTATNNNAVAGNIGEYVSGTVALGSAVTLTTATTANVTSISLTAGDWDVTGVVDFDLSGTTVSDFLMGTSTTSATIGAQDTYLEQALPFTSVTYSNNVPTVRYSLASTTTVYLVTSLSFTGGTAKAYGSIRARRIR